MAITKKEIADGLGTNEKTLDGLIARAAIEEQVTLVEKMIATRDAATKAANDAIAIEQAKLAEMHDALKK